MDIANKTKVFSRPLMIDRLAAAGFWITGGLCLVHMLVWPIDGHWIFRGAFTVFCVLHGVLSVFQKKWLRVAVTAAAYALGWLTVLGWYLFLFHGVHQEALEDRENKLLGQFSREAVAELSKSVPGLEYAGTMGIRGPEKRVAFFENFSLIWGQFFHLGDFLLVVRHKGKVLEIVGNKELARRIAAYEKAPDPGQAREIKNNLMEKISFRLKSPLF